MLKYYLYKSRWVLLGSLIQSFDAKISKLDFKIKEKFHLHNKWFTNNLLEQFKHLKYE